MLPQHPAYLSYLLRLWRAPGGAGQPWRASLQDTLTGQRRGFADLEALAAYLHDQIEGESVPEQEPGRRPTNHS
jgi:hypothetical protein